jgi:hypothetical protein
VGVEVPDPATSAAASMWLPCTACPARPTDRLDRPAPSPCRCCAPNSIPAVLAKNGRYVPLGARPNGNEAWVMLLEKAFAKFMSSYAALESNYEWLAFRTLVGGVALKMKLYEAEVGAACQYCQHMGRGRWSVVACSRRDSLDSCSVVRSRRRSRACQCQKN